MIALGGEPMRDHLLEDTPLDRTVCGRWIAPHQPSRSIARAAATNRAATVSKSASE
jgi:hypothetical protein